MTFIVMTKTNCRTEEAIDFNDLVNYVLTKEDLENIKAILLWENEK